LGSSCCHDGRTLLEEIASEAILTGLDSDGSADVRAVCWIGGNAVDIVYRVNDATKSRLLTRSDETLFSVTSQPSRSRST